MMSPRLSTNPASSSSRGPSVSSDRRGGGANGAATANRRRALGRCDPPDKDALSHLLERRERQDAHPRFWFVTGAGLDPHLDDSQQAVQNVLDGIDVLDPSVRNVTLVAKNQPGRDHELARIESIAEM